MYLTKVLQEVLLWVFSNYEVRGCKTITVEVEILKKRVVAHPKYREGNTFYLNLIMSHPDMK